MDPWLGTVERERTADRAVAGGELEPLVGSLGRLNDGPCIGWTAQALALDGELPHAPWAADSDEPGFLRAFHDVEDVAEPCIALDNGDGCLWLNGFLLGRYHEAGPQRALYAPDPLWRTGRNELAVLHLSTGTPALPITDSPESGRLTREPGVSCPAGCRCRNCR